MFRPSTRSTASPISEAHPHFFRTSFAPQGFQSRKNPSFSQNQSKTCLSAAVFPVRFWGGSLGNWVGKAFNFSESEWCQAVFPLFASLCYVSFSVFCFKISKFVAGIQIKTWPHFLRWTNFIRGNCQVGFRRIWKWSNRLEGKGCPKAPPHHPGNLVLCRLICNSQLYRVNPRSWFKEYPMSLLVNCQFDSMRH